MQQAQIKNSLYNILNFDFKNQSQQEFHDVLEWFAIKCLGSRLDCETEEIMKMVEKSEVIYNILKVYTESGKLRVEDVKAISHSEQKVRNFLGILIKSLPKQLQNACEQAKDTPESLKNGELCRKFEKYITQNTNVEISR